MSDSEHSTVTYTSVSSPVEDYSDMGSPGVDGPPIMPEDPYAYIMAAYGVPPSPDYIPGPEVPPSPDYIPYVPEPVYPKYIPPEDDVFPAEEQPLPAATSPTADSPGYILESDPERDPEEDDEEDPEEDPADYPADRRDDDDDDDDDEEEEDEKEEEHLAPADYTVVALPAVDHVPSEEETEPFKTDECAAMISTDKTKITRKPSKTGKHIREKRKSTSEPKIQSQSQRKSTSINYGST
ncbi:hypothetical protein Tco_0049554 [Tanacetum coccineum]